MMNTSIKILFVLVIFVVMPFDYLESQTLVGNTIFGENEDDFFGLAVDINTSGDRIIVTAPFNDNFADNAGKVRVYDFDGSNWVQVGNELLGTLEDEFLGEALAISGDGNRIAIGSRSYDELYENRGRVLVYELINDEWTQIGQEFLGPEAYHNLGRSVDLSEDGNRLAISATLDLNLAQGADYTRVYELVNDEWLQLGADINGIAPGDYSGWSISLSTEGDIIAIGAPGIPSLFGSSSPGYVHLYKFQNNEWIQLGTHINTLQNNKFGHSLSLSGNGLKVLIGDYVKAKAVMYKYVEEDWVQWGEEMTNESNASDFGIAVALSKSGHQAVIGARRDNSNGSFSGSARLFSFYNGFWVESGTSLFGEPNYQTGLAVAISGDGKKIVVASPRANENSGLVNVYSDFPVSNNNTYQIPENLELYPNPSLGLLTIRKEGTQEGIVLIENLAGRIMKKLLWTNQEMNISDLANGVYFIHLIEDNEITSGKIIKAD